MSTTPPIVQQAESVRVWLRLLVLVSAVAGVAGLVGGVSTGEAEGVALGVALASLFWAAAALVHLRWLAVPQPEKRTVHVSTADGVEFRIGLRPQLPLSMLALGIGFTVFGGFMAIWIDSAVLAAVFAFVALLGVLLIPDTIRALTASEPGAVLDIHGLTYRGYSYETSAAWDDIASGGFDGSNRNLPAVRLDLRPGRQLRWTRRRWIARLEPTPETNRFVIPAIVLDQPWNVLALCEGMAAAPADHRAHYLESVGPTMLASPTVPRQ